MLDCVNACCELCSINSPLEDGHALDCGMNAPQICVPVQQETKGKSNIHSSEVRSFMNMVKHFFCGMNARQRFAHTTQEQGYADAFFLRTVV